MRGNGGGLAKNRTKLCNSHAAMGNLGRAQNPLQCEVKEDSKRIDISRTETSEDLMSRFASMEDMV